MREILFRGKRIDNCEWEDGEWHNFGNYLTHWWNLPEVGE